MALNNLALSVDNLAAGTAACSLIEHAIVSPTRVQARTPPAAPLTETSWRQLCEISERRLVGAAVG